MGFMGVFKGKVGYLDRYSDRKELIKAAIVRDKASKSLPRLPG